MQNKLEIQEFFIEGNDQETSHVLLHIAEPVTSEEKEKGYFFALIEINGSYPEQITHLQEIIDNIEEKYYEIDELEEDSFEKVLQNINKRSHHVLGYNDSEIHCIVGTMQGDRLVIAYHGNPQAYLFYKSEEKLKETAIIDEANDGSDQLFSAVVEGNINAGDFVYLSTPYTEEFFALDRARKILQSRTTRQSAMHIGKVLNSLKNEYSFGGIIMHIPKTVSGAAEIQGIKKQVGSQASMENFLSTAKSTEETMSPSLMKNAKEGIKKTMDKIKERQQNVRQKNKEKRVPKPKKKSYGAIETNYRPRNDGAQENWTGKILIGLGRVLVILGTGIYFVLKKIATGIVKLSQYIFYLITNKNGRRTLMVDQSLGFIDDKKQRIKNLGMFSRILFLALIALALIFLASIFYIKIKENREARHAQYNTLIENIEGKTNDAEGKLLYGEDVQALELLQEARGLVDTLPQKKDEEITKAEELTSKIDELLFKLRKITPVEAELLVDIKETNGDAKTEHLAWLDNKLIVFGSDDDTLYKLDPVTKALETQKHETVTRISSVDVPKEDDKAVFISDKNKIVEMEKGSQNLSTKDITYSTDNPEISDLSIYNRRLYLLSSVNDQIYKHSEIQTGYDRGGEWIANKTDSLENAVSLAVDGDIYVLTNNNVLKFFAGEQTGFEVRGLDPALNNPVEIWTYADVSNLYILEPENKRVVVIDKEGDFVGQYTSDQWLYPTGMIIDESEDTIFVLDNNKVYKFNF